MTSKNEIDFVLKGSPESIQGTVSVLNKDVLASVVKAITELDENEQKAKFVAVVLGLTTHDSLEEVGRHMNASLFSHIMEIESKDASSVLKPLLVGLPSQIFITFLEHANLQSFKNLRQETASEPLQHHLIAAKSHAISILEELFEKGDELKAEIMQMQPKDLSTSDLYLLNQRIDAVYEKTSLANTLLDNLLLLAWNSGRGELIESLSILKENASKFLTLDIGTKENAAHQPTGLFYLLKNKLDSTFEKEDALGNKILLNNEFPALEALACFSLWYTQDFLKAGILNQDDYGSATDEELYHLARKRLEEVGIKTVLDLKEKGIYSQKMLRECLRI